MRWERSGGASVLKSFSDTFNRASSGDLGPNWFIGTISQTPIVNDIWTAKPAIGVITGGIQGLGWSFVGNTNENTSWPCVAIALPLFAGVSGKSQYAEIKVVNISGPAGLQSETGPSVLHSGYGNFYQLPTCGSAGQPGKLYRVNGLVRTQLNAGFAIANGDVVRISAKINVSDVTLTVSLNGVAQYTVVDNSANRVIAGLPGLHFLPFNEPQAAEKFEFINFNAGLVA